MTSYVFSSHDGYGLGHVRRNLRVATAVLVKDPTAQVTVVTGLALTLPWGVDPRLRIVRVPALVKDDTGVYRSTGRTFERAVHERSVAFAAVVGEMTPNVVVVDRHPYGTAGELRAGLEWVRTRGAAVVLGLRDVLDESDRVRAELAGAGWEGVTDLFDHVLVYGDAVLCDHEAEYGLPIVPEYCGWVTPAVARRVPMAVPRARRRGPQLVVTAGGGGDGARVFELGTALLRRRPLWRATVLAGPYSTPWESGHDDLADRLTIRRNVGDTQPHLHRAAAVLQMAGYNSTVEAIASAVRPILVPRRSPRREQAIRASRLAAFGLADVVDQGAEADEVAWLLDRPRLLTLADVARTGIRLDGAERAADRLIAYASQRVAA